jgi:predicted acylesterase/phospholipase RssA
MTIPIQLALQGGGAKITYLVAALEAVQSLEREGLLRVTRIAGTSAGAIAGALYAAGVDMKRVRDTFEAERDDLLRAFPPADASLRAAWCLLTRRPFWNAEPHARLGDLAIPLVIVASDLTNMQPCIYDDPSEPLLASLLDSAGIPFFFRTPPATGDAYRVIVDGGVCENLPCDRLSYNAEEGEVVGISFAAARAGAPVHGSLAFSRALFETALNASELRAHLALGPNNFVIRTDAGAFDFPRAFTTGLGAEYRETRLLAEEFFRRYAARTAEAEDALKPVYHGASALLTLKELVRSYVALVEDGTRVMLRIKALFRARGIKTPGTSVYRQSKRKEWLARLEERGARMRAEALLTDWMCCRNCGRRRKRP